MAKIAVAPTSVLKRSVKVYDEEGTLLRTDTPDATYLWAVTIGGKTKEVNADFPLPCIFSLDEDQGEEVGTITKLGLPNREVRYGPAPVYAKQRDEWVKVRAIDSTVVAVSKVVSK